MFREQYLQNKKNNLDNLPRTTLSVGNKKIRFGIYISISLFILLAASAFFVELPRAVISEGHLTYSDGIITVSSSSSGIISDLKIKNGASLIEGQSVLFITNDKYDQNGASRYQKLMLTLDDTHNRIQQDKAILQDKYALSLKSNLKSQKLIESNRRKTQDVLENLNIVKNNYQKEQVVLNEQQQNGLVTRGELRSFNYEYASLLKDIAYERSKIIEFDTRLENLNNQSAILELNHTIQVNDLTRQINEIQQRINELGSAFKTQVVSPVSGTIHNIRYQNSQIINKGEPLFDVLPNNGELMVKFYLPSKDVGFIEVGQMVELEYDAYPSMNYGTYWGTVKSISQISQENKNNSLIPSNKKFSLAVTLSSNNIYADSKVRNLKVGMKVKGRIILGKRSLIDWVLYPLRKAPHYTDTGSV
ncbi:HlyD family efflux transporter periplasmic adaptor subunit [Vibrio brasiliensis]|uniref:HlyD family secretion protein n=1 Tax=Vibrio brasiliensis TaxID=170652 RepID=UPI001EFDF51F|nr:HlyD family efflux transporter periplasmic adaptor subunit [Vibrio brasiliensis]